MKTKRKKLLADAMRLQGFETRQLLLGKLDREPVTKCGKWLKRKLELEPALDGLTFYQFYDKMFKLGDRKQVLTPKSEIKNINDLLDAIESNSSDFNLKGFFDFKA